MTTHEKIIKVLKKSPFGLTPDEVAAKVKANGTSTRIMLDDLAKRKKITRTKAGSAVFYRIAAVLLLALLIPAVHAQNFTSTSFLLTATVLDSGGGTVNGSTNRSLVLSLGQVSGRRSSENFEVCAGFLCSFLDAINRGRVAFMLSFNITGNENDQAYIDAYTDAGVYNPEELLNYYACLQDVSQQGTPTFGIVHSGAYLGYIRAVPSSSYTLRVSQDIPGNRFIIPVTSGGCSVINARMAQIAQYGTILQPFVILNEAINAVELALNYKAFELSGSFDRTGQFKLVIEKNLTNDKQIIIRPE